MIRKFCKQLHLWLSVPFGLVVIVICLSGAILLFERDFGNVGQSEVCSNGKTPLPMDSILRSTEEYLAGSNRIVGVITYPDSETAYKVMLAEPRKAALWVNQYSGEVIGKYERNAIFRLASSAHRRLFGSNSNSDGVSGGKIGNLIIGITTVALLLIIISGLIVWWSAKGNLKSKFHISTKKGSYRFWFDCHCIGGVLITPVLVVCILTGLNWSFGWYSKVFYSAFCTQQPQWSGHSTPAENFPAWGTAYSRISSENKGKEIRIYQGVAEVMEGGSGNQQASATYEIDTANGNILAVVPYCEKSKSSHINGWVYSLHVGAWFGLVTQIFYLLSVIIGAILPITGYYLWIKRLVAKKRHRGS